MSNNESLSISFPFNADAGTSVFRLISPGVLCHCSIILHQGSLLLEKNNPKTNKIFLTFAASEHRLFSSGLVTILDS